jgi:ATP-dependent Lon protease
MRRALLAQVRSVVKLNKKDPAEILTSMSGIRRWRAAGRRIAAHLPLKLEQKQKVLEMFGDVAKRLEHLLDCSEGEVDILQVEKRIRWPRQAADGEEPREYT